jgi:hypothetical protein
MQPVRPARRLTVMTRTSEPSRGARLLGVLLLPAVALVAAGCAVVNAPGKEAASQPGAGSASARAVSTRAAAEAVPPAARVVTLTMTNIFHPRARQPKPVTVTSPAKVREIAALLDGLQVTPRGLYQSCPFDFGGQLTLTFRGTPGGPALAVVAARLSGCAFVYVSVGGKPRQSVGLGDGGLTLAARAFKIAGLDWKLPA